MKMLWIKERSSFSVTWHYLLARKLFHYEHPKMREIEFRRYESVPVQPNAANVFQDDSSCSQVNEIATARKSNTGSWKACWFILGTEFCERLAYYGINTNLVVYLKGAFNMSNATALNAANNWSGTCFLTPLVGAYVADSFLGRFWTICVFSVIYLLGMAILTASTFIPLLRPPFCREDDAECPPAKRQIGVCFGALYLIALGSGGIKPCVSAFGADQFNKNLENDNSKKSSFFNWFYFAVNIGAFLSSSVLVWIQSNVGWGWGFGIPTILFVVALFSFFSGSRLYLHQKPGGSAFTRIAQVIVASLRNWRVAVPEDKSLLYEIRDDRKFSEIETLEHTEKFRFLDKAAVRTQKYGRDGDNPWHLTTVTQVEELKVLIGILPIWISGIVTNAVFSQTSTLFVEQGQTMYTKIGGHFAIPPASLVIFDIISVIFWIPVYDRIIVPLVSKYTGRTRGFTQLQRIGIGLLISILGMIAAAIVEIRRLKLVQSYNLYHDAEVPMSIFWQVPQYFLTGAAEVFTNIGSLDFFYDQAPNAMRSLGTALSLAAIALGSFLSTLLVSIVRYFTTKNGKAGWIADNLNYGHIDYFFWLLAFLSIFNFIFFLIVANYYQYKRIRSSIEMT